MHIHVVEKCSDDVVCHRRIWKPDRDDGCPHSCTCTWPYMLHNPCIQPSWYQALVLQFNIRLVVSHQSIGTCMIFFGMIKANYWAHKTFFSCLWFARSKISHSKWSESIWIFYFFLSKDGLMQVVMYSAYQFRVWHLSLVLKCTGNDPNKKTSASVTIFDYTHSENPVVMTLICLKLTCPQFIQEL